MDFKEIQELAKIINKFKLSEIKIDKKDFQITIKSSAHIAGQNSISEAMQQSPITVLQEATAATAASSKTADTKSEPKEQAAEETDNLITIKSPMIGTFFRKPAPDKDPFIKVGDTIQEGNVLCVIEAMKLFNEIESEVSGKIVKILVEDTIPVEYDQPLFLVEPN